jgi:transcriptional regulator with GAF, ATPase, and Fis domain
MRIPLRSNGFGVSDLPGDRERIRELPLLAMQFRQKCDREAGRERGFQRSAAR